MVVQKEKEKFSNGLHFRKYKKDNYFHKIRYKREQFTIILVLNIKRKRKAESAERKTLIACSLKVKETKLPQNFPSCLGIAMVLNAAWILHFSPGCFFLSLIAALDF